MSTIHIRGNILESDYVSAQHLHIRARRFLLIMGITVLVLGVGVSILNVLLWMDGLKSASEAMMFPFLAALLLSYLFVFRPWSYRRTYRKQPSLHEPVNIAIGDNGFAYSSEHGEGEIPWRMFIKWREGKQLFLVYSAPNLFHILPKRLLQDEGEERLRVILVNKLGRAA